MAFIRTKIINGRAYRYKVKSVRVKQPDGSYKIKQQTIKYLGKDTSKTDSFRAITSSESVEWYTPPNIINLVKDVLGVIHIDPASSDRAQEWINATTYYTTRDNGLNKPWHGNLWLNPPYGSKNHKTGHYGISAWCEKAIADYDRGFILQGIVLVGGTSSGVRQLRQRFMRCEPVRRIQFLTSNQEKLAPPPPPTFYYLGDNSDRFQEVFTKIGDLSIPVPKPVPK